MWFRLPIFIDENVKNISLLIPIHYRGAQVFFNEHLIFETRKYNEIGESDPLPGKPCVIDIPNELLRYGRNILAIRTRMLDNTSGFYKPLQIGRRDLVHAKFFHNSVKSFSLSAVALFIFLLFFLFYNFKKTEKYFLYLSVIAGSLCLWIIGVSGYSLYLLDSRIAYNIATYLGAILSNIGLILFVHAILSTKSNKFSKVMIYFYAVCFIIALSEIVITGGLYYFNKYVYMIFISSITVLLIYLLGLLSYSIVKGKKYSASTLFGLLCLSVPTLVGILDFLNIYRVDAPVVEGFFAMTLVFASILASRYAQTFTDLEHAHAELLVVDKMKDDFLATTSHELRTPLHGIMGLTENLLDEHGARLADDQRQNLTLIRQSAQRLTGLVNQILDWSKLRAGRADLYLSTVNMGDLVPTIVSLARGLVGEKNIDFAMEIETGLPAVMADRSRVEQVLLNLIGNAVKFTDAGRVEVTAAADEGGVRVTVRDTGRGIAPVYLKRIWNPYEQAEDPDRRTAGGTGLGLPIARHLVELHGGRIWAESVEGRGSSFHVWLPLEPPAAALSLARPAPPTAAEIRRDEAIAGAALAASLAENDRRDARGPMTGRRAGDGGRRATILVVEDDAVNLRIVTQILDSEGFAVRTAQNGHEALEILAESEPHLVLLDLMLPGMSGFDVMDEMRKRYADRFIPVIMVTARNQLEDMVKGFFAGCNDYLSKPFSPRELVVRVENQLVMKNIFDMEHRLAVNLDGEREELRASLVERSRLLAETVEKLGDWERVITEDLGFARAFLDRLMQQRVSSPRVDYAVHYDPLMTIGGDVYDIFEYRPGRVRAFVADATGHGINASLNSITVMSEYNLLKDTDLAPGELITRLNNQFCDKLKNYGVVFTCVLAEIDLDVGTVTLASAGHPAQFVFAPGTPGEAVRPRGAIIGLDREGRFEEARLPFPPGAVLFMYTDGMVEIYTRIVAESDHRHAKDEGDLRRAVAAFLTDHPTAPPRALLADLVQTQGMASKRNRSTDDDITVVVIRRTE